MAIEVICPNGHAMQVPDQFAGKRGKCSKCGVAIVVPQLSSPQADDDPGYVVVSDEIMPVPQSELIRAAGQDSDIPGRPKVKRKPSSKNENDRRKLIWAGAGAGAGCIAVVAIGVLLLLHSRGNPKTIEGPPFPPARGAPPQAPEVVAQSEQPITPTTGAGSAGGGDNAAPAPDLTELTASISLPLYFPPEVAVSLPVGVADPRVEVTLHEGPAGAKIEAGKLNWTPRRTEMGGGTITLRFRADGERKDRSFGYLVSEIPIALPGRASGMTVSADGRLLVVWGDTDRTATEKSKEIILVVDVPSRSITAKRTVPFSPSLVVLSSEYAIAHSAGSMLHVFRLPNLEPVSQGTLFRKSDGVKVVGDRLLWVQGGSLQLPELTESRFANRLARDLQIRRLQNGWLAGPAVLDDALREVQFFHRMFPPVAPVMSVFPKATGGFGQVAETNEDPVNFGPMKDWVDGRTWSNVWDISARVGLVDHEIRKGVGGLHRIDLESPYIVGPGKSVPIGCVKGVYLRKDDVNISTLGDVVAVVASRQLFLVDVAMLGKGPKRPGVEDAAPQPLLLRPEPKQFFLAHDGQTTVRYSVSGGKSPYKIRAEVLTGQLDSPECITPGSGPSEILVDGKSLAAYLATFSKSKEGRQLWVPWFAPHSGSAKDAVAGYIAEATAELGPIVGRKFQQPPVAVPLHVTATDSAGQKVDLLHSMIVELPDQQVLDVVDRKPPPKENEEEKIAALRNKLLRRKPKSLLEPVLRLQETAAVNVSNRIRESWPPIGTLEDHEIVSIAALSLQHEANDRETSSDKVEEMETIYEVGRELPSFVRDYGSLPPRALLDSDGKPLLSWRVLMLPYLGHLDLFNLFRLDEPWDSPHNSKLIPFAPECFITNRLTANRVTNPKPLPKGHCNLLAIAGPRTAFPPNEVRRYDQITGDRKRTLLIVEVDPKESVVWTKPDDLDVGDDPAVFAKLANRRLIDNDGRVREFQGSYALFADNEVRIIPAGMDRRTILQSSRIDGVKSSDVSRETN